MRAVPATTVSLPALGLGLLLSGASAAAEPPAKPPPPPPPRPITAPPMTPPVIANLIPPPPAAAAKPAQSRPSQPTAPRDARTDAPVRRTQAEAVVGRVPTLPESSLPGAAAVRVVAPETFESAQNISLQAALYGAITGNPDVVALRNSNIASPEAVEVARRFPTALNPTVWIDYRPITLIPRDPFGGTSGGQKGGPFYHHGQNYFLISVRQPVELGHQTTYRHEIARATYSQQQWTVVQAELLTLVQTYRFFQTAAYRRERLRVARELSEFNDRLVQTLKQRLEASPAIAADVVLAEVENEATRQQVDVARQDYANALADLQNQIGRPETAGTAEPLGEFALPNNIPPLDDQSLIQIALQSRPEIQVARAAAAAACAAMNLARGDRIPTPVIGPQYVIDEAGIQYVGLIIVSPIPILNSGKPLLIQREADYRRALVTLQQIEQRTVTQVKAAVAKWNNTNILVKQTGGMTRAVRPQIERMERLFDANATDLGRLLQARQRLIQLENNELDALWQATQAQADLLTALGAPSLIAALNAPATTATATSGPPPSTPPPAATTTPPAR